MRVSCPQGESVGYRALTTPDLRPGYLLLPQREESFGDA